MLLQDSRVGKVGYRVGPLPAVIGHRAGRAVQVGQQAGLLGGPGGMGHPCPHLCAVSPYSQGHIQGHQWSPLLPLPLPPPQSRALKECIQSQKNAPGLGKGLHHLPPSWRSLQSQLAHGSLSWPGEGTRDGSRAATGQGPSPASSPSHTSSHKLFYRRVLAGSEGCDAGSPGSGSAVAAARPGTAPAFREPKRASVRARGERGSGRVRRQTDHSWPSAGRGAQRLPQAAELAPARVSGSAAHGPAGLGTVHGTERRTERASAEERTRLINRGCLGVEG